LDDVTIPENVKYISIKKYDADSALSEGWN